MKIYEIKIEGLGVYKILAESEEEAKRKICSEFIEILEVYDETYTQ